MHSRDTGRRILGLAAALFLVMRTASVLAADLVEPDPSLSPEDVVLVQLDALQHNDVPAKNAGIRQAWLLAHPDNRRLTGPLPRFERMIRGASYRPLIDHAAHDIERIGTEQQRVMFKVTIETPAGEILEYLWTVGKVSKGPAKGAWMTTSVPPPRPGGRAI